MPPGIASIAEIPDGFQPSSLGLKRSELIEKLSGLYPECDFANPAWGALDLPGCAIEFNLGESEDVDSFALHVRGDERAPSVVAHILDALGLRALDPSSRSGLFEKDADSRRTS